MMKYEIIVDEENNAEEWWHAARLAKEVIADLLSDTSVALSEEEKDKFWDFASKLPGWEGGPEYAKYPLLIRRKVTEE